jgi:very-short-patch-repair endonuclease
MVVLRGKEARPFYFGATPETLRLAGDLRRSMTPAEKLLWSHLRNRQLSGFRFRRQHPISAFVVDFYCHEAFLAIEADGSVHNDATQSEKDTERTRIINSLGINVLRFTNSEIEHNIAQVLQEITATLQSTAPIPGPSPKRGKGGWASKS